MAVLVHQNPYHVLVVWTKIGSCGVSRTLGSTKGGDERSGTVGVDMIGGENEKKK